MEEPYLFRQLSALGAGDFAHLNGTLEAHLVAVHDLLEAWGASPTLCRAGLYHAAYGTAGFTEAMVALDRRHEIARLIGSEAERIVYAYCACDRAYVWPQIGATAVVDFLDRFTGASAEVGTDELRLFCELSCANELELAMKDASFASGVGKTIGRFFRRWGDYLSPSALRAVARTLPPPDRSH
jgi:hypothetical protein